MPFANVTNEGVIVEIGGIAISLRTDDPKFVDVLERRFKGFIKRSGTPHFEFEVELVDPDVFDSDSDAEVWMEGGTWRMERGDFRAEWNPEMGQGKIRQSVSPYSADSVLRLVHTLLLARSGGFLLHASSGVRNGKAFLFSGVSEAGKTTMARLAPPDVMLLTDEVSYVSHSGERYMASGTPFAGELGEPGVNISAPIAALYLLRKGPTNTVAPLEHADAVRRLMRNVLFFAHDPELVRLVFETVCAFAFTVPVYELTFFPDSRVWELIG